jgi:hypothetical protein
MGIPAREIGWGQKEILLWQIAKQIQQSRRSAPPTTTDTTTVAP